VSERLPENVVICLDISRSMYRTDYQPSRIKSSIEAIKIFINTRLLEDTSSYIALVKFSGKPKLMIEFTNIKDNLLQTLDTLTIGGSSAMGDALGFSIKLQISELRKIAAKTPRILIITDGNYSKSSIEPLKMARLAQGLNIKIDSFQLGETSPMNILKRISDLTGGVYYYTNDAESLNKAAHDIAISNIKTYGDTSRTIIKNPTYLRKIAADLLRVQDLTKGQEQRLLQMRGLADYKKCSICFSDTNPFTKSSFYVSGRYCPNCQTPFHIHCLNSWAESQKDTKMRSAGTVRCPHCFYLLKIPTEVTQAQKLTSLVKPHIREQSSAKTPKIVELEKLKFKDLDNDGIFSSCPICNFIFEEGQSIVRCSNCQTLYHKHCIQELNQKQCKNCGVNLDIN
jgi:uncharacterized protein YegL